MSAAAVHWRRVGAVALRGDSPRPMFWATGLLLVLVALAALLGWVVSPDHWRGACKFGGVPLAFLGACWWCTLCSGAASQNTPANARLVPELNGALRQALAWGWVATMVTLMPLAYGLADGMVLLSLMGLAVSGLGLGVAGRTGGFAVPLGAGLLYAFGSDTALWTRALANPMTDAVLVLCCLGYTVWALQKALPQAGERHWDMCSKQARTEAMFDLSQWEKWTRANGGSYRVYSALLARHAGGGVRPVDMLLHGLGPRNHRYYLLVTLACGVLLLAVRPLMDLLGFLDADIAKHLAPPIFGGAVGGMAMCWARFAVSIRSTPHEQAVLRLAPVLPAGPVLNRVLGRRMLAIGLGEWAAMTALTLLLMWQWQPGAVAMQTTASMAIVLMAGLGLSLDDYARKVRHYPFIYCLLALWMIVLLCIGYFRERDDAAWAILVGLQLATSVGFIVWRWLRMQRGAVAFPANRMD